MVTVGITGVADIPHPRSKEITHIFKIGPGLQQKFRASESVHGLVNVRDTIGNIFEGRDIKPYSRVLEDLI